MSGGYVVDPALTLLGDLHVQYFVLRTPTYNYADHNYPNLAQSYSLQVCYE